MSEKRTGTDEYRAFVRRIVRSYGRKAAAGELDTTALEHLEELRQELEAQTAATVRALRCEEGGAYSWAQVGDALGMTPAGAYKRFGGDGARRPGGQPAHLR